MKIAFLCDYYFPFEVSGAEVSARILAESLRSDGIDVTIITPNFGLGGNINQHNMVPIRRFPFVNLDRVTSVRPYLVDNPLWFLYSAYQIWKLSENSEILHVQNKNFLVGAFIANIFLRKKIVVTARDYRPLCYFGSCLLYGNHICSIKNYFTCDVPFYLKNYTNSSGWITPYIYVTAVYYLILRAIYKLLLNRASKVICLSRAEEKIYNESGVRNTTVISNLGKIQISAKKRRKSVVFVGRYTVGKGREILDQLIPRFLKEYPEWKFIMLGQGSINFEHKNLVIVGQVDNMKFFNYVRSGSLIVVPSIWPEPFGRAALDALSVGTPVLVTNRGGLPEIVKNGEWGIVCEPTMKDFWSAWKIAIEHRSILTNKIKNSQTELVKKFLVEPVQKHLSLYQSLLENRKLH